MPPATNTRRRSRVSGGAPGRAARCQLGFALRREVVGAAAAAPGEEAEEEEVWRRLRPAGVVGAAEG